MTIKAVASRQLSTPGIVDYHHSSKLRRLHYGLDFPAIFHSLPITFGEKKINSAPLVTIASFEESVRIE